MSEGGAWDWDDVKARLPVGTAVEGTVTDVQQYGVWIDLGVGFQGLLLVPEMAGNNPKQLEDYPPVGRQVTATVLWHNDMDQKLSLTQRAKSAAE